MTGYPMIFSAPMVRAMLDGRKTQTRRLQKKDVALAGRVDNSTGRPIAIDKDAWDRRWPVRTVYAPGDRLWVREGFMPAPMEAAPAEPRPTRWNIVYAAGGQAEAMAPADYNPMLYNYERWSPSIHMPRWASRLTLIVTDVRVQRLQDISEDDAIAEGVGRPDPETARQLGIPVVIRAVINDSACASHIDAMRETWAHLHGVGEWAKNPWVVALTFTFHRCNVDRMEAA